MYGARAEAKCKKSIRHFNALGVEHFDKATRNIIVWCLTQCGMLDALGTSLINMLKERNLTYSGKVSFSQTIVKGKLTPIPEFESIVLNYTNKKYKIRTENLIQSSLA
jgi:hypothetical protein